MAIGSNAPIAPEHAIPGAKSAGCCPGRMPNESLVEGPAGLDGLTGGGLSSAKEEPAAGAGVGSGVGAGVLRSDAEAEPPGSSPVGAPFPRPFRVATRMTTTPRPRMTAPPAKAIRRRSRLGSVDDAVDGDASSVVSNSNRHVPQTAEPGSRGEPHSGHRSAVNVPAHRHRTHRWLAMVHVRRLAVQARGRTCGWKPSTARSKGERPGRSPSESAGPADRAGIHARIARIQVE